MSAKRFIFSSVVLMIALTAFTMSPDFVVLLQEKLRHYYQLRPPEKLHLTFNQPVYAPGDTAWYKLSVFHADNFAVRSGRQIAEVILVDANGSPVRRTKILITDGQANNQIVIPSDLKPGGYSVVVFTLPRDSHQSLYQRNLFISGPTQQEERHDDQLRFYPEGGNLVAGVTNKVVVSGPPGVSGVIEDSSNGHISSFSLDDHGLGMFVMSPKANQNYHAQLSEGAHVPLPPSLGDGIGLLATVPANGSPVRLTVQVPESSVYKTRRTQLVMTRHDAVFYATELSFTNSSFLTFSLPQDQLPEGLARINIFDTDGTPLVERLICIRRPRKQTLSIDVRKATASTRDEIPVDISLTDDAGNAISGELAVTVFSEDIVAPSHGINVQSIVDHALLYGDLGQTALRRPKLDIPSLDYFLITQSWSHFGWPDLFDEKINARKVDRLLRVKGRLARTSGDPLPDSTLLSFFLQESVMVYGIFVDNQGNFDVPLLIDFYGEEEIFYQAESRGQIVEDVEVSISAGPPVHVQAPAVTALQERDEYASFARKRNEIERSYAYHFNRGKLNPPPSLNALIEEEVFGADVKISLDDYLLFPTMSETLREIVPVLQHRKRKGVDVIRLFFEEDDRFAEGEPLMIIDGVITRNTTYFLNLRPADVASIAVIHTFDKLRTFGPLGKNGIVLVETKIPGNSDLVPRSDHMFTATGLQPDLFASGGRKFESSNRVPDLRMNLYWNPNLRVDSTGRARVNVHTSDVTGSFRIRVEGFTDRRIPVFAEKEFQVVFE